MKSRRTTVALLWLLLLASVVVVVTRLNISTDMSAFLPRSVEPEEQLLLRQLQNGSSNRILLMAIAGKDRALTARLSNKLAAALRRDTHFSRVLNGESQLTDTIQEPWFRYRYLLQDTDFSVTALRDALQKRLLELRSLPGLYTRQKLAEDPTRLFRSLLLEWRQGMSVPQREHGVWFSADHRALLLAETRAAGFDLDAQQHNLELVRNTFLSLPDHDSAQLVISGAPAIAVASRETIRSEARLATLAASMTVALILLLAYRSWRLWLLSALPLAGAMLTALAATSLLFDTVHGITIAFGITLLGVAIDYPIHLFSHLSAGETPTRSLERFWPTLRLGVASTVIGFLALLFTRFDGLVQLGLFTICGLLTAALVTRYLLPTLLPATWQGKDYSQPPTQHPVLARISLPFTTGLILLSLSSLFLSDRPIWESDIAAISPIPESVQKQDRQLRNTLPVADVNHMLLVHAVDSEALLQAQERFKPILQSWVSEGLMVGYTLLSDRLPSAARQHQRQISLPTAQQLQQRLRQAGEGLPFRSTAFAPFVTAVTLSRDLPPLTLERIRKTAFSQNLVDLLFENSGTWWGVIPLTGVKDATTLQQRVSALDGDLRYVELKAVTGKMLRQFRDDALHNLAWGGLAILLVLGWSSRSLRRLTQITLPLLAAITTTTALLHLFGERLTLFHLTSLLLVLGIGIDYGLFFSRSTTPSEQAKTAYALRVCAISTASVFAILALSRLPVLHAIGMTVLIGVIAAYWLARICGMENTAQQGSTAEAPQKD